MLISEIFRSLQGEGKNQGRPCTFIRCAGCNLKCRWCDTPYSREGGSVYPVEQVLDQIRHFGGNYACITGGEPLLQENDIRILCRELRKAGYSIEIETNGTIDFRPFQEFASICMDVKCPSSGEQSDVGLLPYITAEDCVKFVVQDIPDCKFAGSIIRENNIHGEIFISPVFGSAYSEIASFILENNLPVRMQLQLHKILGVR